MSDIMSQQGSVSGVKSWLSDLPSEVTPMDIIEEEDSDEEGVEEVEKPKSLLDPGATEIIKNMVSIQHCKIFHQKMN